eukprot:989801-Karenia_brevis.AAC.1
MKALAQKQECQERRITSIEASLYRSMAIVSPWGHSNIQRFWSEWHSLMNSEIGLEMLQKGSLVIMNDGFPSK